MKTRWFKIWVVCLLMTFAPLLKAQQEIQNSFYMFNPGILNPAYSGSRNALSGVLDYRHQWAGWDGAPKTAMVSLHSPIKIQSLAAGFNVASDKIGSTNNTAVFGDIAYRVKLNGAKFGADNKQMLSFGLRTGGDFYSSNLNTLRSSDVTDQIQTNGIYNRFIFNIGAGVYYFSKKHYVGFAVPKLLQNKRGDASTFKQNQAIHYYFMAGYVFKINSLVLFKPSTQIKYTKNAPLSVDINASFLMLDKFWVGALYRHKAAVGANIMYQINETLRVGYGYDFTTTAITTGRPSSHELMIGFDLLRNKTLFKSPRYF